MRPSSRPLLTLCAAGLIGFALGYASEAAARDALTPSGGSSAVEPAAAPRGYRDLDRPKVTYVTSGSFIGVHSGGIARNFAYDGLAVRGPRDEDSPGSAFPSRRRPPAKLHRAFSSASKIIDVETARLDRRPIGPSGIDIVYSGGSKIIRIAPGYGRPGRREPLGGTPVAAAGDVQPWSSGWLKHCMSAYSSFDPELGTYVARGGKVRFCEVE